MWKSCRLPEPKQIRSWKEKVEILANYIKQQSSNGSALNILEAGCGTRWDLNLGDVQYRLTGVDVDENALDLRKNQRKDLDVAILGDLRTVQLQENCYHVIYNAFVLEHIEGAIGVLQNFARWLKPDGILILLIPDRNSAKGFLTRILPFWLHIFFKKYLQGNKNAGKPGFDPFHTYFDQVVSRTGIYGFCEQYGLIVKGEYSIQIPQIRHHFLYYLSSLLLVLLQIVSLGRLTAKYSDMMFILEKPS